jgi:hypothetical protein
MWLKCGTAVDRQGGENRLKCWDRAGFERVTFLGFSVDTGGPQPI